MRWRRFLIGAVACLAMLLVVVALLLPRIIEHEVPDVLAGLTNQPVEVDNVSLSWLSLQANVSRLLVGSDEAPALLTENFSLAFDSAALLQGQLRITSAGADVLHVDLDQWQSDNNAEPMDVQLVESWLPERIHITILEVYQTERLVAKTQDNLFLRREGDIHTLNWVQAGLSAQLSVSLQFSPLLDVLQNKRGQIQIEIAQADQAEDLLTAEVSITPAEAAGVAYVVQLEGLAVTGSWSYEVADLLAWPEHSDLRLKRLDVNRIQALIAELTADVTEKGAVQPASSSQDWLQVSLPQVSMPAHRAHVQIDELLIGSDSVRDLTTRVVTRAGDTGTSAGIQFHDLNAGLAGADLKGDLAFVFGRQWDIAADLAAVSQAESDAITTDALLYWHSGHVDLTTRGGKPIELLENARGSLAAAGLYHGAEVLPMRLSAEFDSELGLLGSDALKLQVGESDISGALWTDDSRRALSARLNSRYLNFDVLRRDTRTDDAAPFELNLPERIGLPSNFPMDVEFAGNRIQVAGLNFNTVVVGFQNQADSANIDVSFNTGLQGRIQFNLSEQRVGTEAALNLDLKVSAVDLQQLGLDVPVMVTSAQLNLDGRGDGLPSIVSSLAGELMVELSSARLSEDLQFRAIPSVGVAAEQVTSLTLSDLDMRMGKTTRTLGELLVALPELAVTGQLNTSSINLDTQIVSADESQAEPDPTPLLSLLQSLPTVDLQIALGEFTLEAQTLTNASLRLKSQPGELNIADASFNSPFGAVQWQASVMTRNGAADVQLDGSLQGLKVASLTQSQMKDLLDKPLAGTLALRGRGGDWAELYHDSHLRLKLAAPPVATNQRPEFDIDVELRALDEGLWQADIADLYWRNSDVRGRVTFRDMQPPELRADLNAGYLDLTPFDPPQADTAGKVSDAGLIRSVSNTTARALNFLSGSIRSSIGARARPTDSTSSRYFSAQPWSLEVMDTVDADIKIAADQVKSRRGEARNVTFFGRVGGRQLNVLLQSPQANGGALDFSLAYDATQQPALAKLSLSLANVRLNPLRGVAPMSAFVDLVALGNSERTLASSLNGHVYIEAGSGSASFADFGGGLLTGDLVQGVFGRLLPAAEKAPNLNCAVGYGHLVDGSFAAPATIVMQTPVANVLIQAQADLRQETISAQLDSRSRKGTGLSVGNVFSNTVRLEGSLAKPEIVSNTKGLLWRYGAAVATGGISLIGESVYKRLMIDDEACKTMKATLREKVCMPGSALTKSQLVCG